MTGSSQHSERAAHELRATIHYAYVAGPARDAALANLDSLVEQLEAQQAFVKDVRGIAEAMRSYPGETQQEDIENALFDLLDTIEAFDASTPAERPS